MRQIYLSRRIVLALRWALGAEAVIAAILAYAFWSELLYVEMWRLSSIVLIAAVPLIFLGVLQIRAYWPWRAGTKTKPNSKRQFRDALTRSKDLRRYAQRRGTWFALATAFVGACLFAFATWAMLHHPAEMPMINGDQYCFINHGPCEPISKATYTTATAAENTGEIACVGWLAFCMYVGLDATIFFSDEGAGSPDARRLTPSPEQATLSAQI